MASLLLNYEEGALNRKTIRGKRGERGLFCIRNGILLLFAPLFFRPGCSRFMVVEKLLLRREEIRVCAGEGIYERRCLFDSLFAITSSRNGFISGVALAEVRIQMHIAHCLEKVKQIKKKL
ncbi:hypothetical protein CDAR_442811 [Caerostris darwini]|uniref:Uncharacterized protein n=1 Tax=Caerostris darwini TaxID=1538125 RepID=A0AAV4VPN4_9ARAC|nr:hypothetical protein CDAR_442811 [Caerostris darwini]